MTEKELKRLSRADLLEMLIDQSTELQTLREKLSAAEAALERKELTINNAGSIAEAALQLNGVFEAAEASGRQYLDNIRLLSERQETVCAQMERESREKAEQMVTDAEAQCAKLERETQERCAKLESDTRKRCEELEARAQEETQAYWEAVTTRLEEFCKAHSDVQELLSRISPKQG